MQSAGRDDVFGENLGKRICAPEPLGDGHDLLEWLRKTAL